MVSAFLYCAGAPQLVRDMHDPFTQLPPCGVGSARRIRREYVRLGYQAMRDFVVRQVARRGLTRHVRNFKKNA